MFYEYALIPDIFDPDLLYIDAVSELALTQLMDGIAENAMVASLHKGALRDYVAELVATIPLEDPDTRRRSPRKDIETCMELLDSRNRFVRHPSSPAGTPHNYGQWLDLALQSHQRLAFDGIVVGEDLYSSAGMAAHAQASTLQNALRSTFWRSRQRDATVTKRKGDFGGALAPILRHAKSVTLIDPYIDPSVDRWLNIVDLLGELTGNRWWTVPASWQARIKIHAGDPTKDRRPQSASDRLDLWGQVLNRLPHSFHVTVMLWGKNISGPGLHDRYIITNQCGISCPGGLDCYPDNSTSDEAHATSTWSLLSHDACSRHLAEYEENTGLYKLLDKRAFIPRVR